MKTTEAKVLVLFGHASPYGPFMRCVKESELEEFLATHEGSKVYESPSEVTTEETK